VRGFSADSLAVIEMWVLLENPPRKRLRYILERITGRAKFLVDESLGEGVARVMRELGHNVKFALDVGLGGHSDEDVFAFAWKERRVLFTHDRDYLNDRGFPFNRNPGVIVLPGGHGTDHGLVDALREVMSLVGNFKNLFANAKIEITNDNIWNVRQFEKKEGRISQSRYRFGDHGEVWQWKDD